jgi:hypothetical protein
MWRDASRVHVFSGRGRDYRSDSARRECGGRAADGVGDGRRPGCGVGREWGVCGFTEIASPSRRKRSANRIKYSISAFVESICISPIFLQISILFTAFENGWTPDYESGGQEFESLRARQ